LTNIFRGMWVGPRSCRPRTVIGFYGGMLTVGVALIVVGCVIVLGDWDRLSDRMPTQVLPRRVARYPLVAGTALVLLALIGRVFA
jgi:TRAP-type C4-dicarboxylate transport system permease small subunit